MHSPFTGGGASPFGRGRSPFMRILATKPFVAWGFANATMFQDTAGLIPAGIGDPVALVLDPQRTLGSELWDHTNVDLRGEAEALGVNDYRVFSTTGDYASVRILGVALEIGKLYQVDVTVGAGPSGSVRVGITGPYITEAGSHRVYYHCDSVLPEIKRLGGATDVHISNVSFREVTGHHLTQGVNDDFRPTRALGGLWFDGIDDYLRTVGSVDLSHADEITAMIALTKDSDAATGYPLEFSTSYFGNEGSFQFNAPPGAAQAKFGFAVHGTNDVAVSQTGHVAPKTAVLTGISKISTDVLRFQVDDVEVSNTSDLGTGSFGNWPLFVGCRNGTSRFFSGTIAGFAIFDTVLPDTTVEQSRSAFAAMQGRTI